MMFLQVDSLVQSQAVAMIKEQRVGSLDKYRKAVQMIFLLGSDLPNRRLAIPSAQHLFIYVNKKAVPKNTIQSAF
jgi:hypothetical protein